MLEWIPAFFEKATAFVPRMIKIPPTHRLVKWSQCEEATLHGPGLVWYWPLVTEILEVDVRWVSTITYVQSVTMQDGTGVSARGKLVWAPTDVLHAVTENADYEDRVSETLLSCVVETLSTCEKDSLRHVVAMNFALTVTCREALEPLGIDVQSACFTELVTSPAFRLINDGS
ncbi:MAG: hypothetical protein GY906_04715 [bacterium]|nr:hypothetical protein [bacterium]